MESIRGVDERQTFVWEFGFAWRSGPAVPAGATGRVGWGRRRWCLRLPHRLCWSIICGQVEGGGASVDRRPATPHRIRSNSLKTDLGRPYMLLLRARLITRRSRSVRPVVCGCFPGARRVCPSSNKRVATLHLCRGVTVARVILRQSPPRRAVNRSLPPFSPSPL